VRVLDAPHQIARIGECRDPPLADQHRVPADVIDMQMRADHGVDRLARITRHRKVGQEIRL
jgi:hypothetical protein